MAKRKTTPTTTTTTPITGETATTVPAAAGAPFLVRIIQNERGNPPGKLADAELHFTEAPLAGLKLIGFAVWESRDRRRNVTFPARQYSVNGERRSFALLRPTNGDLEASNRIRDLILQAYAETEG